MNKLQRLMKDTACNKEPAGIFAYYVAPMPNPENPRDLKLSVVLALRYKSVKVDDKSICKPIDLAKTMNDLAGRILPTAKKAHYEKQQSEADQAKDKLAQEQTEESLKAYEKEQAEADQAKDELIAGGEDGESTETVQDAQGETASMGWVTEAGSYQQALEVISGPEVPATEPIVTIEGGTDSAEIKDAGAGELVSAGEPGNEEPVVE